MTLSPSPLRAAALTGLLLGVTAIAFLASLLLRDVYAGIPAAVPVSVSASCDSESLPAPCEASLVQLNPGRFRVATSAPASSITLQVDGAAAATVHVLLARSSNRGRVAIGGAGSDAAPSALGELSKTDVRFVFPIPAGARPSNRIVFAPERSGRPTVIDEIGFFVTERGLLRSENWPWQSAVPHGFYFRYLAIVTLGITIGLVVAGYFVRGPELNRLSPWLVAVLCVAIGVLEIGTTFSPYEGRDLRSFYASEWLPMGPDSNLTGGLYEGSRIVQGLGITVRPGFVQWHRMPGYGALCALTAFIARTTDVIEIAALVVLLQVVFYAVAAGVFVFVAQRVFPAWVAWLLGVLLAMLPKQLAYTQPDSLIAPIQMLVLAGLLCHLIAERDGRPTFGPFVWVNLAFALWFVMRNDVLFGWMAVTTFLAIGHWRRLALPLTLILAIAIPWGLYKQRYRHEFNLMPTNAGEVLLLSLCEVPGAFPYACTDDGYVRWARNAGHFDATTNQASAHAGAEVVRHWVTYPVHFGFMVFAKARRSITSESFPGFATRFSRLYGNHGDTWLFVLLLPAMLAALATGYDRRRTFLLGWAIFFNMPLFFIAFASNGRFYAAASVSLVAATVPLVCDRGFYRALADHPWRVTVVVACLAAFVAGGSRVERLVTADDKLHYWAPLLDPERSSLRFTDR